MFFSFERSKDVKIFISDDKKLYLSLKNKKP